MKHAVILMSVISSLVGCSCTQHAHTHNLAESARSALESADHSLAYTLFSDLIALEGTNSLHFYGRASAAYQIGNMKQAIEDMEHFVQQNPRDEDAISILATWYLLTTNRIDTIPTLNKLILMNHSNSLYYKELSAAYAMLLDFTNAVLALDRSIDLDPYNDHTYLYRGKFRVVLGQCELAQHDLNMGIAHGALTNQPEMVDALRIYIDTYCQSVKPISHKKGGLEVKDTEH